MQGEGSLRIAGVVAGGGGGGTRKSSEQVRERKWVSQMDRQTDGGRKLGKDPDASTDRGRAGYLPTWGCR